MPLPHLDLSSPDQVEDAFVRGAAANRAAKCRQASIDLITPPGTLIATGDLHDNPTNLETLVKAAALDSDNPRHLMLHEIIHSDRLIQGMDFSYRALARVAALKADFPEHVHVLLGNHELAQIVGAGIIKDGIKCVEAFNAGVEYAFGGETERVQRALNAFVRSLPIALRCVSARGDILCCHSLPSPGNMFRFDTTILTRDLTEEDYQPRTGSAHFMVWGRGYDLEQLEDLVERWGINLFVLGHEKAEDGIKLIPPNAIVLNSDSHRGVYLPLDLEHPPTLEQAAAQVVWFSEME